MKGFVARITGAALGALLLTFLLARPAAGAATLEGLPAYDHVFVLVLENESFATTFSPTSPAHYLNNTLVPAGVLDDQYYGIGHESLDDYLAMTSGQPDDPARGTDCVAVSLWTCAQTTMAYSKGANITDQLEVAGLSWKGYMDSMPLPCFHQPYAQTTVTPDPYQGNGSGDMTYTGDYADRHNPFVYYPDIVGDNTRCTGHVRPYTELATDLSSNTVPNYVFITPDTCHDGHDMPNCTNMQPGGLGAADAWLQSEVPPILSYVNSHNGLLIITFDEGAVSDFGGCCHGGTGGQAGFGGRVGLVALGPSVKVGQVVHTQYDHASLLRTTEDIFGIGTYLNNAAPSSPMRDLFVGPAADVPETPLPALIVISGLPVVAIAASAVRRRARMERT